MQTIKNIYHLVMAIVAVVLYRYPARSLTVIGVTGTDGKTTTTNMIYHVLKQAGKRAGMVSTIGAKIGDQTIDIGLHVTTPSPFTLQKLLRQMVNEGCQYAVVEVTSHGLDQHRLFGCNFRIGVLTNITHEHLDYHKTLANYVKAKSKLFKNTMAAVLNVDGPWFEAIKQHNPAGQIITYGLSDGAVSRKTFPLQVPIEGEFNIANALGAAAVCKALSISDETIKAAIATFGGIAGRMEPVEEGQPFRVIVDFAHTPHAIEEVLQALKFSTVGRLIVVFGSAGLRDKAKRPISGEKAATIADITIITADDPATEDVIEISRQIAIGCLKAGADEIEPKMLKNNQEHGRVFTRIPDRAEAICTAIVIAEQSDTIALLGKGHQKSLSVGHEELPWNEKQIAITAIKELWDRNQKAI